MRIDIRNVHERKVDNGFVRRITRETLKKEKRSGDVSFLFTGNDHIRELNRKHRSVDRVTDVLSFPMDDEEILGDVVISLEKTEEQAGAYSQSFERELARLIIHGLLHLAGYGDSSRQQKKRMEERQEQTLKEVISNK